MQIWLPNQFLMSYQMTTIWLEIRFQTISRMTLKHDDHDLTATDIAANSLYMLINQKKSWEPNLPKPLLEMFTA